MLVCPCLLASTFVSAPCQCVIEYDGHLSESACMRACVSCVRVRRFAMRDGNMVVMVMVECVIACVFVHLYIVAKNMMV